MYGASAAWRTSNVNGLRRKASQPAVRAASPETPALIATTGIRCSSGREYVSLPQGRKIVLGTTRRSTPYFYDTRVVGTEHADGQQLTVLHRPAETAVIAPRRAVRVPVSISDGQFWWEGEDGKFGPLVAGSVVDVFAGGFQAMSKNGLPPGMRVLARFTLSRENGYLMTDALVLRTYERVSDAGVKSFRSHSQFAELPERDRDRLIKFVFQRERELLAKGVF
jgi:c-di-GMP-binding flagellar brake protein YcgR